MSFEADILVSTYSNPEAAGYDDVMLELNYILTTSILMIYIQHS
jgi:hypothetical protein